MYRTPQAFRVLREHVHKIIHAHNTRTRAGEQNTPWTHYLHSQQIETAVSVEGLGTSIVRFSKSGRVKYDYVELLLVAVCLFQIVKYVGYEELVVVGVESVQREVLVGCFYGWCGDIDAGDNCLVAR